MFLPIFCTDLKVSLALSKESVLQHLYIYPKNYPLSILNLFENYEPICSAVFKILVDILSLHSHKPQRLSLKYITHNHTTYNLILEIIFFSVKFISWVIKYGYLCTDCHIRSCLIFKMLIYAE